VNSSVRTGGFLLSSRLPSLGEYFVPSIYSALRLCAVVEGIEVGFIQRDS
jgi:hypothetical protein